MGTTRITLNPVKLKEQGNNAFKAQNWDLAINFYTKAITIMESTNDQSLHMLYKNRAAANLKIENYQQALNDCNKVLEHSPNDLKALFRRCQALEHLERFKEACCDARQILHIDPTNKIIPSVLDRLYQTSQKRLNNQAFIKITKLFEIAFTPNVEIGVRKRAMHNILVLVSEKFSVEMMIREGIIQKINHLLNVELDSSIILSAIRIITGLCRNSLEHTKRILNELKIAWLHEKLNSSNEEQVNAIQCAIQTILNTLNGITTPDGKPDQEISEKNHKEIDTILNMLLVTLTSRFITGLSRDSIIELLNMSWEIPNWPERFIKRNGLKRLMKIASELIEYQSAISITNSTHRIISSCLARLYDNLHSDESRQNYLRDIESCVKQKLLNTETKDHVRAMVSITILLQGSSEVGHQLLDSEDTMEMILRMASSDDSFQQKTACECILAAISKKERAASIMKQSIDVFKKLYKSDNNDVKIRALVTLCKFGSYGGQDASIRPFTDGSNPKLAEICCNFLTTHNKNTDLCRWAVEGLSYLTLDADVKEKLINNPQTIHVLFDLAKTENDSTLFALATILANLSNAYERNEVTPEMIELAQYTRMHIPSTHEWDGPNFVVNRVSKLAREGVVAALCALLKTKSANIHELNARIFNAICAETELRGIVVQQGGVNSLLKLTLDNTEKGKKIAAHALARIGSTIDPKLAFLNQRMFEVIRPLINLLHPNCSSVENLDALLALCNLAYQGESVRQRIVKEGGLTRIEYYMYENHTILRRVAIQVLTNMVRSSDVVKIYEEQNDRIKYLMILCGDDDEDTVIAASGVLATLVNVSSKCCEKIYVQENWWNYIYTILAYPNMNVRYRGVYIINVMILDSQENARKLIDTEVFNLLKGLSQIPGSDDDVNANLRKLAAKALQFAEERNLVQS